MAPKASFCLHHPTAVQLLCLTEKYLIAGINSGSINILDLQCRHVESYEPCEHRRVVEVGKIWIWIAVGMCWLRDMQMGLELQRTLSGHGDSVVKVLMSNNDSVTVISSSRDLRIIVWDVRSSWQRHILPGIGDVAKALLQHENLLFAGANDEAV
ncbi:hypothetical protein K458DRAFT_388308 [Lentithecium fluviatile CBS 122367]|uniref:Uncharacterized protein n=1 Tax=Lentithecium fluviatile CBS 122367 TaxID=1168545 RepID=A0A6G1J5D8_9PLEO|nr:hypothetical protein K458DRAFT_388308 [Lentithecium fluviatile CBS 122367]